MKNNWKKILNELSYRVSSGIPDLTNEQHLMKLWEILKEHNWNIDARVELLKNLSNQEIITEASTRATTFYHEVATAIYCVQPNAKLVNGSDFKKFFQNRTVEAFGVKDWKSMAEADMFEDTESNKKAIAGNVPDAKKLSILIRSKLGKPSKPMYWTGKAGDQGKYGAGDIGGKFPNPFGDIGVSLKKGTGQLKNLTLGTFSTAIGLDAITGQWFVDNYTKNFDAMTSDWIDIIDKEVISLEKDKNLSAAFKRNGKKKWSDYQKQKINEDDKKIFMDTIGKTYDLSKISKETEFKRFIRKLVESIKGNRWTSWSALRDKHYGDIFGDFMNKNEESIRANLVKLFERQLSLGKSSIFYAADAGKTWWFLPSAAKFKQRYKQIKDELYIDFYHQSTGSGYVLTLQVGSDGGATYIANIDIIIRFAQGQMQGLPSVKSSYKMGDKMAGWSAILGGFDL